MSPQVSASAKTKLRVAIVGAGPGGLTLAVALSKFSDSKCPVVVDLYESQPQIGTVGAGLSVWPRTRAPLTELGLMQHLQEEINGQAEDGDIGKVLVYRKSDEAQGYPVYQMESADKPLLVHRSTFIHAIEKELPPSPLCTVHPSKRLSSLTQNDEGGLVTMYFADGSSATADVVIGADGIRSVVRTNMLSEDERVEPQWSGVTAYRALVTREMLEANGMGNHAIQAYPQMHCGRGRHLVTYPISRGECVNTVALVTRDDYCGKLKGKWVRDAPVEEMREAFAGWEPEVETLLQASGSPRCVEQCQAWALHVMLDLPRCASGRVAILGDAMHAMETSIGAGAGQAIEDAYILARLLTHSSITRATIPLALQAYNRSRLALTADVVRQTHHAGRLFEFNEGPLPFEPANSAWQERWGQEVSQVWDFQMHAGEAERCWKESEEYLRENLAEMWASSDSE
ncbi:FAD/NAD(P)-binding domain-containing protein [Peniophora sp. CONT]|nr:FAD/NAD(P)-binding domain-containing protein [Peniophora sp. CONT]